VTYRRLLLTVLALGLVACLFVALRRERHEQRAARVEIALDDQDFQSLARSYGYEQRTFLTALRGAGLTSLAVQEELGGQVASSPGAAAYSGTTLLNQARLTGFRDPVFARLAAGNQLRTDEVYLIAYDPATAARYARQLRLKFSPSSVHLLRAAKPAVFAIRTQADYFGAVGLGLPNDRVALAHQLGLKLLPRLENDERLRAAQIEALVADAVVRHDAHTIVFFGLRNQVLGYPDAIADTAQALRAHRLVFGTIETYDAKQNQAGSETLAQALPDRTVRVQAIAKAEQDKLKPEEIVQRYLLGARERNVRVVYFRPFAHQWGDRSIQATNVELVRQIALGLNRAGLRTGTASPFDRFVSRPWEIALASLAVPAIVLLLLAEFGLGDRRWLIALVVADVALVLAGFALHHDMAVRKLLALAGGIAFPVAGFAAIAPAFRAPRAPSLGAALLDGVRVLAIATLVTLGGVLVVIGLLSTPLTMTEIDRFSGVKLVLALPPLIALLLYVFTRRWGSRVQATALAVRPVTVLQLVAGAVLLGAGYLLLARSGNQSDIAPSTFELALRAHLTTLLQVRPRLKEFLIGFPALMLLPALVPADRARWGWLFALAIGVGLGDVIDTFSHLHTALGASLLRLLNGAVIGIVIGAVAVVAYRRFRRPDAGEAS
jgi:cbb3-type cytochrome oxidase subunit 3